MFGRHSPASGESGTVRCHWSFRELKSGAVAQSRQQFRSVDPVLERAQIDSRGLSFRACMFGPMPTQAWSPRDSLRRFQQELPGQITVDFFRQTATVRLGDLTDRVLPAVRIRHVQRTFRIVTPLTVHKESVVVRSRCKFDAAPPYAIRVPPHVDGSLLPVREVTNQLHAHRRRCRKSEGLHSSAFRPGFCVLCVTFLCHICLSVAAPRAARP